MARIESGRNTVDQVVTFIEDASGVGTGRTFYRSEEVVGGTATRSGKVKTFVAATMVGVGKFTFPFGAHAAGQSVEDLQRKRPQLRNPYLLPFLASAVDSVADGVAIFAAVNNGDPGAAALVKGSYNSLVQAGVEVFKYRKSSK